MPVFEDYHRTVVGFHGTTVKTAKRIVSGDTTFKPSRNDDWLGHGIYFWEYAPQQAWAWAKQRYGDNTKVAVLGAMIRLGNCFDLLDPENNKTLLNEKRELERLLKQQGQELPNNVRAKKRLDCAVFEYTFGAIEERSTPVDTVRAVFVPTKDKARLWPTSSIYDGAHIQLCVRNTAAIIGTWLAKEIEH